MDQHSFTPAAASLPRTPTHVGPYRLIREIGRGGMGTVFLGARDDDAFHKRVAIKVLKRGMDTDAIVRRFRNERQILAGLEHPHIAGLLDGGTTPDGLPYFAMEYVEGQSITDYCETHDVDTTARLQLFRKVCEAVHYAHQNLVIHRDIKPGNVLVTADGTPKLLDFGIAKLLNPAAEGHTLAATVPGLQLMTPEYASPEQVRGEPVTTASDVYSLGVLLYELLTGRRPYRLTSRAPSDIARVVCESVPERPSTAVTRSRQLASQDDILTGSDAPAVQTHAVATGRLADAGTQRLRRRLAGDLDTIVLKALSKEPSRRYASADQFSEDVRRHLSGLPVIARRDTLGYRASKFAQRNRSAVVGGVLVLLALIAGIVGTAWQARAAYRERARAEQRFNDVRRLANTSLFELHDAIRDLPGSTPARQLLVTNGLDYLDKLARDAGDRPDLKRELAGAYIKVGDVQGRPFNPNLGDTAGALDSYQKATAIYESLGAGDARDATLRREAATAYVRMSEVLSSTGQTSEALAFSRKGNTVLQTVANDASAPADVRRELAASYSRVGDLLSASGDTNGALEHRRKALAMMESLATSAPDDVANLRQLGAAFHKLGNTLGNPNAPNVGDHRGALQQLAHAAAVFRRAIAVHPDNALFKRNLAVVEGATGDVLLALGRREEALARQQDALARFQALADADPSNASARNDVAIGLSKVAELHDAAGRPHEAEPLLEQALAIHSSLFASDPANEALKLEVTTDYNRLATVQVALNQRDALDAHTRAVTMSRELTAANPGNVELRVALALALMGRADGHAHFARRGSPTPDVAAAARDYGEAIDLLGSLERDGVIGGTDLETLAQARRKRAALGQPAGAP